MSTAATKQGNENFIFWTAVRTDKTSVFTPAEPVTVLHESRTGFVQREMISTSAGVVASSPSSGLDVERPTHAAMLKLAKKSPPPQDWFDEDVSNLRGPKR